MFRYGFLSVSSIQCGEITPNRVRSEGPWESPEVCTMFHKAKGIQEHLAQQVPGPYALSKRPKDITIFFNNGIFGHINYFVRFLRFLRDYLFKCNNFGFLGKLR